MKGVACVPCLRGSFNSAVGGVTACENCAAGTYMTGFEAVSGCTLCPAGKYSTAIAATAVCSLEMNCAEGAYTSMAGATASVCNGCAAGTFADGNATACIKCVPGFTSTGGSKSCSSCPPRSFSAYYGAASCVECPLPTTASAQLGPVSAAHCRCNAGYTCKYTPQLTVIALVGAINVSDLADAAGVPMSAVVLR